jgi:hypothetical protein
MKLWQKISAVSSSTNAALALSEKSIAVLSLALTVTVKFFYIKLSAVRNSDNGGNAYASETARSQTPNLKCELSAHACVSAKCF